MQTKDLIEYIFEGADAPLWYSRMIDSSPRFKEFVETNRDKIRGKVRGARKNPNKRDSDEAYQDVLAESYVACLLLSVDRFSGVDYERDGTKEHNPDFAVTDNKTGDVFNVEVKRIRRTEVDKRFERWKWQMEQGITTVESGLAVSIFIEEDLHPLSELLERLEADKEKISDFIRGTIAQAESKIPPGGKAEYRIPGLDDLVRFELSKPLKKPSRSTSYYGGVSDLPRTGKEYKKFGDDICNPRHLRQMRPGMVNVLAIVTDSYVHDEFDLGEATWELLMKDPEQTELPEQRERDDQFFAKKGFGGAIDFFGQFKVVSGILFLSQLGRGGHASNPVLWNNPKADCPIPDDIVKALEGMH